MATSASSAPQEAAKIDQKGNSATTSSSAPAAPATKFTLDILPLIKTAQNQNGLRRAEYSRYKAYCSKRLHRIRTGIKFMHGKTRFAQKFVEPKDVTDKRHLELLLIQAERAWAAAMEYKEDEGNLRAKFHIARRLAKAVVWSSKLVELCHSCADEGAQLESQAYHAWMKGNQLFEQENWKEVVAYLIEAKTIYENLAKVAKQDQSEFYTLRVEELTTLFKYAVSKSETGAAIVDSETLRSMMSLASDDPALKLLQGKLGTFIEAAQTQKSLESQNSSVKWQGRTIVLRSPTLRLAFVKASEMTAEVMKLSSHEKPKKEASSELSSSQDKIATAKSKSDSLGSKLAAFDRLLALWNETKIKIRDERALLLQDPKAADQLNDLQHLMSYATFSEQSQMITRNLLLIGSIEKKIESAGLDNLISVKPDEVVRLYELVLQLSADNESLLSAQREATLKDATAQGIKLDREVIAGFVAAKGFATAKEFGFKSLRCYYLALSYAQAEKWPEAVALLNRSLEYSTMSLRTVTAEQEPKLVKRLGQIPSQVKNAQIWTQSKAALFSAAQGKYALAPAGSTPATTSKTVPVNANILTDTKNWDASYAQFRIVDFPPTPQPIAAKPVLFDLAASEGFQAPDLTIKAKAPKTGFLSSFWG